MAEGSDEMKKLQVIADRTSDVHPSNEITDATLERVTLSELDRIRMATDGLAPTGDLLEAVMKTVDAEAADPFAAIAHKTAHIRPTDDLTDAVMLAVAEPANAWGDSVMRAARPSLFFASIAAAAAIALSWYTERSIQVDSLVQAEVSE